MTGFDKQQFKQEWRGLLSAMQFLTVIPVGKDQQAPDLARAISFYPVVGLVIGGLLWLLACLEISSYLLQAALLVSVWIWLTGGLHLDGLADMADGWAGGLGDKTRTLEIMKDPCVGSMAVMALFMVLSLKVLALASLLTLGFTAHVWAVPVIARLALLPAFLVVPPASPDGLAAATAKALSAKRCVYSLLISSVVLLVLLPFSVLLAWLIAALVVFLLWQKTVQRRLGGFNGDCAGALIELTELSLLLVAALSGRMLA